MPVKSFKPTTPSRRGMTVSDFAEITTDTPEKSLMTDLRGKGGRNVRGKVTTHHQGGGVKRAYRIIDFKRNKLGVPARVATIEYDPNRSSYIALLFYVDGEKRYIIAPVGLQVGDELMSGPDAESRVGNAMPLANIPLGSTVHNVELRPGKGGQIVRSAGAGAQVLAKEGDYVTLRMPSGEVRMVLQTCMATLGQWATPTMATSSWAKLVANAGWVFAQPCAVRRCRPATIRMVVVKAARPSARMRLEPHGARRR